LTHKSSITMTASRADVALDLIGTALPFSLDFYRQFARDGFDAPSAATVMPITRWTTAPSFYVRTVTEDTGEPVSSAVLEGVHRVLVNGVPELTGGQFSAAAYESGAAPRPPAPGWIAVLFYHSFPLFGVGEAVVGRNPGLISVSYDSSTDSLPGYKAPGSPDCGSAAVEIVEHELVHAMGFYHTDNTADDFHTGPGCPGSGRPARVVYHAAVMYTRPPGNTDPDNDPAAFSLPLSVGSELQTVVVCTLSQVVGHRRSQ
jgi:hypothetical protein